MCTYVMYSRLTRSSSVAEAAADRAPEVSSSPSRLLRPSFFTGAPVAVVAVVVVVVVSANRSVTKSTPCIHARGETDAGDAHEARGR